MLFAWNNGNVDTANVLFIIAAICFGIAVILHLFGAYGVRAPAEPAGRTAWWGTPWTTVFVDAGLCLMAIAFYVI